MADQVEKKRLKDATDLLIWLEEKCGITLIGTSELNFARIIDGTVGVKINNVTALIQLDSDRFAIGGGQQQIIIRYQNSFRCYNNGGSESLILNNNGDLMLTGNIMSNGVTQTKGIRTRIRTVSTDITTDINDHTVCVNSSDAVSVLTIALHDASSCAGQPLIIKDLGTATAHNILIDPSGSQTIDGQPTFTIDEDWTAVSIQSTGTGWILI